MSPYVIVTCCLLTAVTSSRLLLLPYDHKGNVNFFLIVGQELHERGHDVDVLVPKRYEALVTSYGLNALVASYSVDTGNLLGEGVFTTARDVAALALKGRKMVNITLTQLRELFADDVFLQMLRAKNYDLILIDGIDYSRPLLVIPHYLAIKFIVIICKYLMAKSEIREIYFTSAAGSTGRTSEVNFSYFTSCHQVFILLHTNHKTYTS